MGSLYKLILRTNIKSPVIAFPLVFPIILMLMYTTGIESNAEATTTIFTLIAMMTMQSGLMGFGFNFMNLKKSVLLRRIGATKMKKWEVLGAVALYGITIWFISMVWVLILAAIFSAAGMFYVTTLGIKEKFHINWDDLVIWKIFIATIIGLYTSFALGLFFVSISKTTNMFQGITMLYFFSTMFLGGMIFNSGVGQLPDWMIYIGYLIPHSYVTELFKWSGDSRTLDAMIAEGSITKWKFILDIIVPILVGTLALAGAVKFLKFD